MTEAQQNPYGETVDESRSDGGTALSAGSERKAPHPLQKPSKTSAPSAEPTYVYVYVYVYVHVYVYVYVYVSVGLCKTCCVSKHASNTLLQRSEAKCGWQLLIAKCAYSLSVFAFAFAYAKQCPLMRFT